MIILYLLGEITFDELYKWFSNEIYLKVKEEVNLDSHR